MGVNIQLRIDVYLIPCEDVLVDIRIKGAGEGYTSTPIPNALSVKLQGVEYVNLDVGQLLTLDVEGHRRFFGRISDLLIDWEDKTTQITALGPLEHLGWIKIPPTGGPLHDKVRVGNVLNSVYGSTGWSMPTTPYHVHRIADVCDDADAGTYSFVEQTALDAIENANVSGEARLVETPAGHIEWIPIDKRLYTDKYTIDACYVLRRSEWSREAEQVVNAGTLTGVSCLDWGSS